MIDLSTHAVIAFALGGAVTIWLKSDLPCLLTRAIRSLGWHRGDSDFWPDPVEIGNWTRPQWSIWAAAAFRGRVGRAIVHLLNCPYCLAVHLSGMAAAVEFCVGFPHPWVCVAYPAVILVVHKHS